MQVIRNWAEADRCRYFQVLQIAVEHNTHAKDGVLPTSLSPRNPLKHQIERHPEFIATFIHQL